MIPRRALPLLAMPAAAQEAPLRVLSGGALEPAVRAALARWTGTPPRVTFDTAPRMVERLVGGEEFDLLLAPGNTLSEAIRRVRAPDAPPRGGVTLQQRVGSVAVGVALREDAPTPTIANEWSFRNAVTAADALVFNRASTGLYMEQLFSRLGLTDAIAAKSIRFATGEEVLLRIARGQGAEIGFAATTEILLFRGRNVRLAAPLPEVLANRTAYVATLLHARASGLFGHFNEPPVRDAMRAAGVE